MKKNLKFTFVRLVITILLGTTFWCEGSYAQSNDDEMAKGLLEKINKGKGDFVLRPSDLPQVKPESVKSKVVSQKVNMNTSSSATLSSAINSGTGVASKPNTSEKELQGEKNEHIADMKTTIDKQWDYENGEKGPENWGKLSKENVMCHAGQLQSPINIESGIQVDLPEITFDYKPSLLAILDNGHTIQVNYGEGSNLSLQGKQYRLTQLDFHNPSEEAINGKHADMSAHLVHQNFDGSLLVVAIMLNVDESKQPLTSGSSENALFQQILNNVPLTKNVMETPAGVVIDMNQLLPKKHGYYTYMGSLTSPPCSENVSCLVLKEPIKISKQQLENFSRIYPNNVRPLQPKGDRLIKETR